VGLELELERELGPAHGIVDVIAVGAELEREVVGAVEVGGLAREDDLDREGHLGGAGEGGEQGGEQRGEEGGEAEACAGGGGVEAGDPDGLAAASGPARDLERAARELEGGGQQVTQGGVGGAVDRGGGELDLEAAVVQADDLAARGPGRDQDVELAAVG